MKERVSLIVGKARQVFGGTLSCNLYKDYVLALLFLKAADECYKSAYLPFSSEEEAASPLRLLVTAHSSFDYLYEHIHSPMFGELINQALKELEQANGLSKEGGEICKAIDFTSNNLGESEGRLDKLRELFLFFRHLSLTDASSGRLLDVGLLYMQLLYAFADEAGKKLNMVQAPWEVVHMVAELADEKEDATLCDSASGNGILLVKTAKRLHCKGNKVYGQEANWNQYALAKMNLLLNGLKGASCLWGDCLAHPKLKDESGLKKFDLVVSIPPLADKWVAEVAATDRYNRFRYGIPPRTQATWAYISHILATLEKAGQAVVVVPVGVLFRNTESKIRRNIIESNLLDAVVELPSNLFLGTAVSTALLVFRQGRTGTQTLFVDMRQTYLSGRGVSKLPEAAVRQVTEIYRCFRDGRESCLTDATPPFRIVTQDEIRHNGCDLQVSKYVKREQERPEVDVEATMHRIQELESRLYSVNEQLRQSIRKLMELYPDKSE